MRIFLTRHERLFLISSFLFSLEQRRSLATSQKLNAIGRRRLNRLRQITTELSTREDMEHFHFDRESTNADVDFLKKHYRSGVTLRILINSRTAILISSGVALSGGIHPDMAERMNALETRRTYTKRSVGMQ